MCGIVGYAGKTNVIKNIMTGLKSLEYRGYDSSGIAYLDKNNNIKIYKKVGQIKNLDQILNYEDEASLGISHTRWATHGGVTDTNAHPHNQGKITLVHNGIIENYEELKRQLEKEGYNFKSSTDSEVAAALIDKLYKENKDMSSCKCPHSTLLRRAANGQADYPDGRKTHLFSFEQGACR